MFRNSTTKWYYTSISFCSVHPYLELNHQPAFLYLLHLCHWGARRYWSQEVLILLRSTKNPGSRDCHGCLPYSSFTLAHGKSRKQNYPCSVSCFSCYCIEYFGELLVAKEDSATFLWIRRAGRRRIKRNDHKRGTKVRNLSKKRTCTDWSTSTKLFWLFFDWLLWFKGCYSDG